PHSPSVIFVYSLKYTSPSSIYTLSLHDALPILPDPSRSGHDVCGDALDRPHRRVDCAFAIGDPEKTLLAPVGTPAGASRVFSGRSEKHTSELQSRGHLVCRLLLVKKNTLIELFT